MDRHWVIGSKKPKVTRESVPSSSNCKCPALMLGNIKGNFSDKDARVYYCINPSCGKIFTAAGADKFNNDEEAREYFKQIVSEIKLPKLGKQS
ncbi:MAG: hypothetical protein ACRDFB_01605 [Rhabdochlamydiaceae bacterium]